MKSMMFLVIVMPAIATGCAQTVSQPDTLSNHTSQGEVSHRSTLVEGFTAICRHGSAKQVEQAIEAGADMSATGKWGDTPLMAAAADNPHPQVIEVLIKAGADVNEQHMHGFDYLTPLQLAAANNSNPKVITALVKAGADVNAVSRYSIG